MEGNTFVTMRGDRISLAFGRRPTVGRTGNGPYLRVDEVSDGGARWRPLLNFQRLLGRQGGLTLILGVMALVTTTPTSTRRTTCSTMLWQ